MQRTLSSTDICVHGKHHYTKFVAERKYEMLEQIGKGGFGTISTVRDSADRILVCKSIPKTHGKIKNEIRSLLKMQGGNVIRLHDFYEDDGHYYLVMDKGYKDLHSTHVGTCVSESETQCIIANVLKVLAQSHAKGILHLDIKAGNLLWMDEMQKKLVLIDWGLSEEIPKHAKYVETDGFKGTPWFMAPEQLRSEASPKTDVWAVGVLCVQLLTGRFPFNDKRNPNSPAPSAIWRSVLCDEVDTNGGVWRNISPEAKHFVRWMLAKEVEERPTALEALEHPWLRQCVMMADTDTTEKRKRRYDGLDSAHRVCLEMLAERLHMDPVELSSSLGNEKRKDQYTRDVLRSIFQELECNGRLDVRMLLHHKGVLLYEEDGYCMSYPEFEEFVLKDPSLPLYAF